MNAENARQHAWHCLAHPLAQLGIALVLLNALWLQPHLRNWWSGKLGDLGWMMSAPLLLAAVLSLLLKRRNLIGVLSVGLVGGLWIAVKLLPSVNAAAQMAWLNLTGWPLKLQLDRSDLLVLPGLAAPLWIWFRHPRPVARRSRLAPALMLGLSGLALLADAPAPTDLGITCLAAQDANVYAFRKMHSPSYMSSKGYDAWNIYRSSDGGLNWEILALLESEKSLPEMSDSNVAAAFAQCATHTTVPEQISDPGNANIQYLLLSGKGIYRSTDGGKTLQREVELPTTASITDMLFDPLSNNLIVAAGTDGLWTRAADGNWLHYNE